MVVQVSCGGEAECTGGDDGGVAADVIGTDSGCRG